MSQSLQGLRRSSEWWYRYLLLLCIWGLRLSRCPSSRSDHKPSQALENTPCRKSTVDHFYTADCSKCTRSSQVCRTYCHVWQLLAVLFLREKTTVKLIKQWQCIILSRNGDLIAKSLFVWLQHNYLFHTTSSKMYGKGNDYLYKWFTNSFFQKMVLWEQNHYLNFPFRNLLFLEHQTYLHWSVAGLQISLRSLMSFLLTYLENLTLTGHWHWGSEKTKNQIGWHSQGGEMVFSNVRPHEWKSSVMRTMKDETHDVAPQTTGTQWLGPNNRSFTTNRNREMVIVGWGCEEWKHCYCSQKSWVEGVNNEKCHPSSMLVESHRTLSILARHAVLVLVSSFLFHC